MLRGLWTLAWLETKIFVREPLGLVGTLGIPVLLYVLLGRMLGGRLATRAATVEAPFNLAVLAALFIAMSAVLSLVAIMAIYREGGILKRLRATPLSPLAILGAHVVVKLGFSAVSLALLWLAGRQFVPGAMTPHWAAFAVALLASVLSILSLGFVIASVVPTARFAQPLGAALFYPMLAISGLFFPVAALPPALQAVAWMLPTTHAVAVLQATWSGAAFGTYAWNVGGLAIIFVVSSAVATRVFRWE